MELVIIDIPREELDAFQRQVEENAKTLLPAWKAIRSAMNRADKEIKDKRSQTTAMRNQIERIPVLEAEIKKLKAQAKEGGEINAVDEAVAQAYQEIITSDLSDAEKTARVNELLRSNINFASLVAGINASLGKGEGSTIRTVLPLLSITPKTGGKHGKRTYSDHLS